MKITFQLENRTQGIDRIKITTTGPYAIFFREISQAHDPQVELSPFLLRGVNLLWLPVSEEDEHIRNPWYHAVLHTYPHDHKLLGFLTANRELMDEASGCPFCFTEPAELKGHFKKLASWCLPESEENEARWDRSYDPPPNSLIVQALEGSANEQLAGKRFSSASAGRFRIFEIAPGSARRLVESKNSTKAHPTCRSGRQG